MSASDDVRKRRDQLRHQYEIAYERLSSILFSEDPVGVKFEDNTDEYEPEAGTILPRLRDCRSVHDVRRVVHEEFVGWFDAATAGPPEKYQAVAERIWSEVVPGLTS